MGVQAGQVRQFTIGTLKVEIHPDRASMGAAAAAATADALKRTASEAGTIGVIFATGASQLDTLEALTRIENLPWNRVSGFHLDEYVNLALDHPASFRGYLRRNLTQEVRIKDFLEIDGNSPNPEEVCQRYAEALRAAAPVICMLGIGENGHLAFNDPDVADFDDPKDVKVVSLDEACRQQQLAEGWFQSLAEVPGSAISLTIPAVFRVPTLIVSVPGSRKAAILRRTLEEPISTACPATILRTHPDATLYLDQDAAAELGEYEPLSG
jgi:glucosamine-6-phosphate deaminase